MTCAENILDELDASIFSGDTFHNREDLENLKYHLERWGRAISDMEDLVNTFDQVDDEDE